MSQDDVHHLIIGRKPVQELLHTAPEKIETIYLQNRPGRDLHAIIDLCRTLHIKFKRLPADKLHHIFPGNHQGVIARIMSKGFCTLDEVITSSLASPFPLVLALDQVQDPGNLGTLCRTLFALGGGGIIVPKNRSAFPGPAASRASAGALEKIPMAQVTNLSRALETCARAGVPIYGAGLGKDAASLFAARLVLPAVLVLGNEEKGIRPGVLKRCDHLLTIPMAGTFDSLNVAQAGAMIMGQFLRTRHAQKG
ncbi:23S rRNA (guanosine(2251)-2'-O)-methyltransferase RlmB [Desulfoplanes formicivorans]|uniref:RNA methyltransferase n=1 Tax=Desulfoplanes formicivorans TaxID=1592317 RepID=A0A194AE69_9BACT|nr:23S rRNA (guanosine(2251)-2'-O)-methyltransferase RlmB [Desulfoplanes formicivorans]GAU08377.1 RNA methyltransferase [Desulfoplanes formicivorans]